MNDHLKYTILLLHLHQIVAVVYQPQSLLHVFQTDSLSLDRCRLLVKIVFDNYTLWSGKYSKGKGDLNLLGGFINSVFNGILKKRLQQQGWDLTF